jgi:hypothetical protein
MFVTSRNGVAAVDAPTVDDAASANVPEAVSSCAALS